MPIKIAGILQARMKSTRLQGKVMMPVLQRPLLSFMVERITASRHLERLVVATSTEKENDPIERFCRGNGIEVFRGSEDDVLDRLYQCAKNYRMEHIARFSGDNPLIDLEVIDRVLSFYMERFHDFDYVSNNHPPTWPDGMEVEVMPFSVLERTWKESDKPFQREHGTPYIWDSPEVFRIGNVESERYLYDRYRWTLDYREDFEFVREIYERLYPAKKLFSMEEIIGLLEKNPNLERINAMHRGYTWYEREKDKLKTIK